ncbi:hypothetical protein LTR28_007304, partial [Elasticomyces elasticus]
MPESAWMMTAIIVVPSSCSVLAIEGRSSAGADVLGTATEIAEVGEGTGDGSRVDTEDGNEVDNAMEVGNTNEVEGKRTAVGFEVTRPDGKLVATIAGNPEDFDGSAMAAVASVEISSSVGCDDERSEIPEGNETDRVGSVVGMVTNSVGRLVVMTSAESPRLTLVVGADETALSNTGSRPPAGDGVDVDINNNPNPWAIEALALAAPVTLAVAEALSWGPLSAPTFGMAATCVLTVDIVEKTTTPGATLMLVDSSEVVGMLGSGKYPPGTLTDTVTIANVVAPVGTARETDGVAAIDLVTDRAFKTSVLFVKTAVRAEAATVGAESERRELDKPADGTKKNVPDVGSERAGLEDTTEGTSIVGVVTDTEDGRAVKTFERVPSKAANTRNILTMIANVQGEKVKGTLERDTQEKQLSSVLRYLKGIPPVLLLQQ